MPAATLSITYDRWPPADRALWEAACQPGDFLECGPASHLRERSRRTLIFGYSRWLRFVERTAPAALAEAPAARITPERLKAYTAEQSLTLSPSTVWNDIKAVYDMIRFMVPEQDWTWIKKIKARLEHRARAVTHQVPLVDSGLLCTATASPYTCGWNSAIAVRRLAHSKVVLVSQAIPSAAFSIAQ